MVRQLQVRQCQGKSELRLAQAIRREVFVREQKIPQELDRDGRDAEALHLLVWEEERAVATGRLLLLPTTGQAIAARIAVLAACRRRGIGTMLVRALERLAAQGGVGRVLLHPHAFLERFYRQLGYTRIPGGLRVGSHRLITMQKELTTPRFET